MKNALRAGALALATIALLTTVPVGPVAAPAMAAAGEAKTLPPINVDRIRRALKLTSAQKAHWPAVESALRALFRRTETDGSGGLVRRIGRRAGSFVLNGAALHRLAVAARPLIAALSEEQKSAARGVAAEMGLGGVVVAALR